MPLRWRMHTNFPFSRIFALGIIMSLLGLASMIISIIAFVIQSWGHYAGTGMWGGALVLASGLTAVFVSQLRTLASVKTFCVFSIISVFTSLVMLILSAGGLSLDSEFYSHAESADYNKRTSNLIHASLLVISVFCLSGSILAVIVCCKYLIFAYHDKPKCHLHNRNSAAGTIRTHGALRGGASNSSSIRPANSRTPLQASVRHSDNMDVSRAQNDFRRYHKHSISADQPNSKSHSRRQRHNHQDSRSNNANILSPSGFNFCHERRHESQSASQVGEMRGDNKERERLNIVPPRQVSSRPFSQVQIQARLSGNPVSSSPNIRLPTEFDEEELPPYEVMESATNVQNGSHSDSGDESDTENSSTTDANSYVAAGEEGTDIIPNAETENNDSQESHCAAESINQHTTNNFISFSELHSHAKSKLRVSGEQISERQTHSELTSSDPKEYAINETSCNGAAVSLLMQQDSRRSDRHLLNYKNISAFNQKDFKHDLFVLPELCPLTAESLELAPKKKVHMPNLVQENFYENGPCYENVRCAGSNVDKTRMNHLSKSSSPDSNKTSINSTSAYARENGTQAISLSPIKKPAVLNISSPTSCSSLQSPQSSFGPILSDFRPIDIASATLSPHVNCSPMSRSHLVCSNNDGYSPYDNVITDECETQNASPHIYINALIPQRNNNSTTKMFIEQGAIPKDVKQREDVKQKGNVHQDNNSGSLSLKSIKIPLSYNHSESASNESEKKLPSKMIPFTNSKSEISHALLKQEASSDANTSSKLPVESSKNRMSSSEPSSSSSVLATKTLALPVSSFGTDTEDICAASAKLNNNRISETADALLQLTASSPLDLLGNITLSSVKEASTQVNSVSTSRWHSRQMGGTQSLLQSRQNLQNSQICHRPIETSTRAVRPSSIPLSSGICHGISGLTNDRHLGNRTSEASSANHSRQQLQSLTQRQNHLLQHYPLQPQQPRLGVQLHQRRQQQHQLQQNIESQQQYQQMQQQPQQPPQLPQQDNRQGHQERNGRPLFSVLL